MSYLRDCEDCQREQTPHSRALIGCGHLAPEDQCFPWQPEGLSSRGADRALTACPGYTTRLPQVLEAQRAYPHWERGTLAARYDGREPSRLLLDALEWVEGANNEAANFRNRPKEH